jgi:hypothetical protein
MPLPYDAKTHKNRINIPHLHKESDESQNRNILQKLKNEIGKRHSKRKEITDSLLPKRQLICIHPFVCRVT